MSRPSRFSLFLAKQRLAITLLFFVTAWPLHLAHHAAEPSPGISAGTDAVDPSGGATAPDPAEEGAAQACAWCWAHAQQAAAPAGDPGHPVFHARSGPPPRSSPHRAAGGPGAFAVLPRGPPEAG